jgi:hypothetical protein
MPEPVTCHAPRAGSTTIECDDVVIDPEPGETEQIEVDEGAAGARALVDRTLPGLIVRGTERVSVPIDAPALEVAEHCAAELIGVGLGVVSIRANPAIGTLATLKASIDLWQCSVETIRDVQKNANEARGVELCEEKSGTPLGIVEGSVVCARETGTVTQ